MENARDPYRTSEPTARDAFHCRFAILKTADGPRSATHAHALPAFPLMLTPFTEPAQVGSAVWRQEVTKVGS